ncbi:MAG TPA: hypothetical protein VLQ93_01045 [Myxococcaceae bacterium]|nr:hypothetical protein [Myxococcaceae bacterium]
MRRNPNVSPVAAVHRGGMGALALVSLAGAGSAQAQCDDSHRMAYLADVQSGATEQELESKYGFCRETSSSSALVTNYNVFYERMNGCGVHPQRKEAACDVEIRQSTGYGAFPGGSMEHVLFCFDCNVDGVWDFGTRGQVHVTNDVSGTMPSWYHAVIANASNAPAMCAWGSGSAYRVRAILSWAFQPTSCNFAPIWGNRFDFKARFDP